MIIYPVKELTINPFLIIIEAKWVFLLSNRTLLTRFWKVSYNFWLSLSFIPSFLTLLLFLIQIIKCPFVKINLSSFDVSESVSLHLKFSNQNKQSDMTDPVISKEITKETVCWPISLGPFLYFYPNDDVTLRGTTNKFSDINKNHIHLGIFKLLELFFKYLF